MMVIFFISFTILFTDQEDILVNPESEDDEDEYEEIPKSEAVPFQSDSAQGKVLIIK